MNRQARRSRKPGWSRHATPTSDQHHKPRWDRWHATKSPKGEVLARRRAANKVARRSRKRNR